MPLSDWLLFALLGKLLIYLTQQFPPIQKIKAEFFQKLFECDLCLGVWIYFALSFVLKSDIFDLSIPILGEFLTGAVTSFLVHVFSVGYKSKFLVIEVE
jgi:hypothetical protein